MGASSASVYEQQITLDEIVIAEVANEHEVRAEAEHCEYFAEAEIRAHCVGCQDGFGSSEQGQSAQCPSIVIGIFKVGVKSRSGSHTEGNPGSDLVP